MNTIVCFSLAQCYYYQKRKTIFLIIISIFQMFRISFLTDDDDHVSTDLIFSFSFFDFDFDSFSQKLFSKNVEKQNISGDQSGDQSVGKLKL